MATQIVPPLSADAQGDWVGALFDELRALRLEVQQLRDDQQCVARRMLAPADRRDLAVLLPQAERLIGDGSWTAAELFAATLSCGSSELLALLADYSSERGGLRSFGGFLERCAGATLAGLRLVELGRDRGGVVYQAKRVSVPLKPAQALPATRVSTEDQVIFEGNSQ